MTYILGRLQSLVHWSGRGNYRIDVDVVNCRTDLYRLIYASAISNACRDSLCILSSILASALVLDISLVDLRGLVGPGKGTLLVFDAACGLELGDNLDWVFE